MLSSVYCCGYFFRVYLECLAFQTALLFSLSLSLSLVFVRGASALRPNSGGGGFFLVNSSDTRLRLTFTASFIPGI